MQFTDRELKAIDRMRKRQRQWSKMRWVQLALCLFYLVFSTIVLSSLAKAWMDSGRRTDFLISQIDKVRPQDGVKLLAGIFQDLPLEILMFGLFVTFASAVAVMTLVRLLLLVINWRGFMERELLLKLLDAERSRSESDAKRSEL